MGSKGGIIGGSPSDVAFSSSLQQLVAFQALVAMLCVFISSFTVYLQLVDLLVCPFWTFTLPTSEHVHTACPGVIYSVLVLGLRRFWCFSSSFSSRMLVLDWYRIIVHCDHCPLNVQGVLL